MSDTGNDPPDAPDQPGADDLFTAAGRRPNAPEPDPEVEPDSEDELAADSEEELAAEIPITSAESPFPDGDHHPDPPDVPTAVPSPTTDLAPATPQYRPPRPGSYGYHTPPPAGPDGQGGYRAGAYPAGPPVPPQPQFGRRAPQAGPQPDADGYYPSDYYLGTDWTRVVVGGLASLVLVIGLVAGGLYLFDRFDPRDDDEVAVATPTPTIEIPVYACAGDADKVTDMAPPQSFLVSGRDAGSRWLAFRNPQSGRRQLWIRAASLPDFDPSTVGVVSCASGDTEFPTPLTGPASPTSTSGGAISGFPSPTPVATPTP